MSDQDQRETKAERNKREKLLILKRQRDVARLLRKNMTLEEMAEELNVHMSTIRRDIEANRKRWEEERLGDTSLLYDIEYNRLKQMAADVFESFQQALKGEYDITVPTKSGDVITFQPGPDMKAISDLATSYVRVSERLSKLAGLDAPTQVNVLAILREESKAAGLSDEETEAILADVVEFLKEDRRGLKLK